MWILNLITFIARSENTFACNQSFTCCLVKPQPSSASERSQVYCANVQLGSD